MNERRVIQRGLKMARKGSLRAAYEGFGRQVKRMQAEHKKYREAIEWALGANEEFDQRPPKKGAYWWREKLAKRAGLRWDGEKYADV